MAHGQFEKVVEDVKALALTETTGKPISEVILEEHRMELFLPI
jgi:hypothetical protein